MEIRLSQSIQLYDILSQMIKKAGYLPIRTAYKFSKLIKATESDHQFYIDKLNELIQTYAELDEEGRPVLTEDGSGIKIRKEELSTFEKEINDLWNVEVTVPDIKFKLEELEGLELTIEDTGLFFPFIEE